MNRIGETVGSDPLESGTRQLLDKPLEIELPTPVIGGSSVERDLHPSIVLASA